MMVVNLVGQPGAGKSTGAAYIFSILKMHGINAELVTEFAKDKVYEGSKKVFENQRYIFGKQSFKQSKCIGDVDVIVTDSPLLLSYYYAPDEEKTEAWYKIIMDEYNKYDNMLYFVNRVKPYNPKGRFQTEEESDKIAEELNTMFAQTFGWHHLNWINGDFLGYEEVIRDVLKLFNVEPNEMLLHPTNLMPR